MENIDKLLHGSWQGATGVSPRHIPHLVYVALQTSSLLTRRTPQIFIGTVDKLAYRLSFPR